MGDIYQALFPLFMYLNDLNGQSVTPEIRNKSVYIAEAIIRKLLIAHKYGIDIPVEARQSRIGSLEASQKIQREKIYPPCIICGETRITHECHIIPRSDGGPDHPDNYLWLCPLHHHLFDHGRLTKDEWGFIEKALDGKMESAVIFSTTVRLQMLKYKWGDADDWLYVPDKSLTP
jgi:hypothetical protein